MQKRKDGVPHWQMQAVKAPTQIFDDENVRTLLRYELKIGLNPPNEITYVHVKSYQQIDDPI